MYIYILYIYIYIFIYIYLSIYMNNIKVEVSYFKKKSSSNLPVVYPEGFQRQETGLGNQIVCPN